MGGGGGGGSEVTFSGERIKIWWERVYWEEIFPGGRSGG